MASILVIDDDDIIRSMVVEKLRLRGHTVFSEDDGAAGIATALEQRPEIVIVDWMMPSKNGIEVCRALRAEPTTAGVHILMLTARAQDDDIALGFAAGVDDFLTKPFSPRDLMVRVDSALGTQSE